jgi:H+-transporting ATPase
LWGPIPWVLEVTLILTLGTHRFADSAAIAFLLLFNAVVATWQEGKAGEALEMLRSRIVVSVRVKRDGQWATLPGDLVVPGDLVHIGVGDVIAADMRLLDGSIDVDESTLTGESLPKTIGAEMAAFAGTVVQRGDADAIVTATGSSTKFGRAAQLVRTAKATGTLERLVVRVVSVLSAASVVVIAVLSLTAVRYGIDAVDIAVFAVMIALASVPIALPAAFTLATTLGSVQLAKCGALVTRLSAVEDAAAMDVLCTDKTGTITENRIAVDRCLGYPPFGEDELLALAAAASDDTQKDRIDAAILHLARERHLADVERTAFTPFDPSRKSSAADVVWNGAPATVYKGAPGVLRRLALEAPETLDADVEQLAAAGSRILCVALQQNEHGRIAGLIALSDPPRVDARELVSRLHGLGIDVELLTGDSEPTALHVARAVGIPDQKVHASIYPEDKLSIIRTLQKARHVVGMTGDGINDAPALKQANIGIAVANAADVAKAAAGVVLTDPGLANIVPAIEEGRRVYERMLTYTMMKLVKYFEIVGVLTAGFFLTKSFLLTPSLMIALLVFNDFVTLSIATDNVAPSHSFDAWHVGRLMASAVSLAALTAFAVLGTVMLATRLWHLGLGEMRSVVFLALVVMGQVAVFVVRERRSFFGLRPSHWLLGTSAFALSAASLMALYGILMQALPAPSILAILALLCGAGLLLNALKLPILATFGFATSASTR